tara:strand:+ start:4858 stop:5427 length:570 start_codon:yes stop_codon:yes gene_type:complete
LFLACGKKRGECSLKKKGQMLSMPFVYILVIVVIGFVLIFGTKAVKDIWCVKDETQIRKFFLDLSNEVEIMYNLDVGSGKKFRSLSLPESVDYVCLYDPGKGMTLSQEDLDVLDEDLFNHLDISLKENVFIVPLKQCGSLKTNFYVVNLRTQVEQHNPLCVEKTSGWMEFVLESYLEDEQIFVGSRVEG